MALNLPIKHVTDAVENGVVNQAYEIDISQQKSIEKALNTNKLDCFPLLWVISNPNKSEWKVEFKQRVACKYIVCKLLNSHKNNLNDNNIDMYNLTLNGYYLKIPN
jgi:hypothetical protein